jgi:hypothetical protein
MRLSERLTDESLHRDQALGDGIDAEQETF